MLHLAISHFTWSLLALALLVLALCLPHARRTANKRPSRVIKVSSETWPLDGLPPSAAIGNCRSLAGQIIADATRGRAESIQTALDEVGSEQGSLLLAATDLANGHTALMLAAAHGHEDCCRLLLARGASPLAQDRRLHTAAELAASAGHTRVVDVFVVHQHARPWRFTTSSEAPASSESKRPLSAALGLAEARAHIASYLDRSYTAASGLVDRLVRHKARR